MLRSTNVANGLVVLGVALLVAPALFPLQPVLTHDTRPGTASTRAELEERGYEIVRFENLSERGQSLYVRTLRADGQHQVPVGEGAPDFDYPRPSELDDGEMERDYRSRIARHRIVIERPEDDDHLPPADEPVEYAEHRRDDPDRHEGRDGNDDRKRADRQTTEPATPTPQTLEERRRQIARYDVMATRTDRPPLTARSSLIRLVSAVLGVLGMATGGYGLSKP